MKNTRKKILCLLLLSVFVLSGCNDKVVTTPPGESATPQVTTAQTRTAAPDADNANSDNVFNSNNESTATAQPDNNSVNSDSVDSVSELISGMTLEQKIAQLFVITPEALTGVPEVYSAGEKTKAALEKYPVGGLIYFANNIKDPAQLKSMLSNTASYGKEIEGLPLFLAVDEEGGRVARVGKNTNFDVKTYSSMHDIGDTKDSAKAEEAGKTIGTYLKKYGFNLDFAPDADVITNPKNTVINDRSFGTDPELVSDMVTAAAKGFESVNILPCVKHFPGHGSTEGDTHEGFAFTKKSWAQLKKQELLPFQAAIKEDIPFIMVSHISVPTILGDNTPSTLSKRMVTTYLRKQLNYKGIIITDAMNMGAIIKNYDAEKSVIKAFKAGVDVILMPNNFEKAYAAMLEEVKNGSISEDRIDESLYRIISLKLSMK